MFIWTTHRTRRTGIAVLLVTPLLIFQLQARQGGERLAELSDDGVSIVFGGDVLFGRSFAENSDPGMTDLFEIFRRSDAAIVNLEQVMSTAGSEDPDYGTLVRADPELLGDIEWAGVDAVSLANNHSMNYGAAGMLGTIAELDRRGIKHAGGGRNLGEASAAAIVEAGGLRIGLLSLYSSSSSTSGTAVEGAGNERPGMFLLRASDVNLGGVRVVAPVAGDLEAMIEAIDATRGSVDILVVSIHSHWGSNTFQEEFAEYHPMVARAAIDAGADLFLIHGPHVPRGIEAYKHGFIAYSIGNLFWNLKDLGIDPEGSPSYVLDEAFQSIVVRAIVQDKRVQRVEVIPLYLYREGEYQGIPRIAGTQKAREILDKVARLSRQTRTDMEIQGWFGVVRRSADSSQ